MCLDPFLRHKSARVAALTPLLAALLAVPLRADDLIPPDRLAMAERARSLPELVEGGSITPHWRTDGSAFWYAEGAPAETVIWTVDPATGEARELFDSDRLRAALAEELGHAPPWDGVPFDTFTFEDDERTVRFELGGALAGPTYKLDLASYEITATPAPTDTERDRTTPRKVRDGFASGVPPVMEAPSPDGRFFLGEAEHDLTLRWSVDARSLRLTDDGSEDRPWSMADARWAPDSLRALVFRHDRRGLARLPVVHWLKTTEEVEFFPYTKSGGAMEQTEPWVIDVLTRRKVRLDVAEARDAFFYPVGWRPDGSEILLMVMNRRSNHLRLIAADPATGATRTVVEERSDTFLGALEFQVVWPDTVTLLGDGEQLIWLAERDGWRHAYLYHLDGRLIRRLTRGDFPVERIVAVDEDEGFVYLLANAEPRPYDTHLYRVPLAGGRLEKLTGAEGEHAVVMAPSKRYFLDTHSTPRRPPVVEWRRADGTLVKVLSRAGTRVLERELRWRPPETFTVTAADGETPLHGVLYQPWDFDPAKRYPVVDYIYNGPFITWAPQTFLDRRGIEALALAQLGFVTVVLDGRGTTERGKAFQDVVYRAFGRNEIPDHATALEQLAAERPFIDLSRVGIFGGSWGGYMTIRALLLRPDLFGVGVATNAVTGLIDHPASAIEGYMGLPQDMPEAYEEASNLRLADRLEGHLLLIHGTSDVNATFSNVMKMAAALVRADKPYDLLVLPEESHRIEGQASRYADLARWRYFVEHLRPYGPPAKP